MVNSYPVITATDHTQYSLVQHELIGLKTGMLKDEVKAIIGEPFTPSGGGLDIQYENDTWFNLLPAEDSGYELDPRYKPPEYILSFDRGRLTAIQLWMENHEQDFNGIKYGDSKETVSIKYGRPYLISFPNDRPTNVSWEYPRYNMIFNFDTEGLYAVTYYDPEMTKAVKLKELMEEISEHMRMKEYGSESMGSDSIEQPDYSK